MVIEVVIVLEIMSVQKRVIVIDQGNRNIEVLEVLLVIEASWFEQSCVYMFTC